jgi:hypothetical protein
MGVDRTDYLMYGWKLPYNSEVNNNEKYLPNIEGHKNTSLRLIADGMSGEYMVWGLTIEVADEYEGWEFLEIDIDKNKLKEELMKEINKLGFIKNLNFYCLVIFHK